MQLIYDHDHALYFGERLTVTPAAYDARVTELIAGGMDDGAAHAHLLDESAWAPNMAGVRLISEQRLCLQCRQPLAGAQERFCDVVCEAAFHMETHS